jgi:hypothetical protein
MNYKSIDDVPARLINEVIDNLSDVQMNITIHAEANNLDDPFELVSPISHARKILKIVLDEKNKKRGATN